MWHTTWQSHSLVMPSARRSFKASPHKDAMLIPVKTQTLLFQCKPPFCLAQAGSRVLFSQPFHLFHRFSPSSAQLSPRSNPQPLMPMSSFLPFPPVMTVFCFGRGLPSASMPKLRDLDMAWTLGFGRRIWTWSPKLYLLKVTRCHKRTELHSAIYLWEAHLRRLPADNFGHIEIFPHWVLFSSGVILLVLNDCTVYSIGISFLGEFYYGAQHMEIWV